MIRYLLPFVAAAIAFAGTTVRPSQVRNWKQVSTRGVRPERVQGTKVRLDQTTIPPDWYAAWSKLTATPGPASFRVLVTPRQEHPILITCYYTFPCTAAGVPWFGVE